MIADKKYSAFMPTYDNRFINNLLLNKNNNNNNNSNNNNGSSSKFQRSQKIRLHT